MKKFRVINVALDNVWPWILELFENLIFSVGLIQNDRKINICDQRVTYAFLTMWYVRMLIESEVRILTYE